MYLFFSNQCDVACAFFNLEDLCMCRKKFSKLQILRFRNLPADAADVAPTIGLPQNAPAEVQFTGFSFKHRDFAGTSCDFDKVTNGRC